MPQKTREALSVAGFLLPAFCESIAFFCMPYRRRNAGTRLTLSIYDRSSVWGLAPKMPPLRPQRFPLKNQRQTSKRASSRGRAHGSCKALSIFEP
jgi:hypothetical protein